MKSFASLFVLALAAPLFACDGGASALTGCQCAAPAAVVAPQVQTYAAPQAVRVAAVSAYSAPLVGHASAFTGAGYSTLAVRAVRAVRVRQQVVVGRQAVAVRPLVRQAVVVQRRAVVVPRRAFVAPAVVAPRFSLRLGF